jgi:hypothetical protein
MPAFTVYLADPYQLNLFRAEISSAVVNLFSQVLPKRGSKERFKYDAIEVRHASQHIQVMSSALLIYLIESSA